MTPKLKSNKDVKDYSDVTFEDWASLKSCNMLRQFYPFAQGISYQLDCRLYNILKSKEAQTETFVTAVVPSPSEKPAHKPFSQVTKAEYNKLFTMGLLWVCYPQASGDYLTDFPPKPIITKVYAHGDRDNLFEKGSDLGLSGDALQVFSHCLYEIEFELQVDPLTGETIMLSVDGRKLCE